jgi:hypothetical protein
MSTETNELDTRKESFKAKLQKEEDFEDTIMYIDERIELIQSAKYKNWPLEDIASRIQACLEESLNDIKCWRDRYDG